MDLLLIVLAFITLKVLHLAYVYLDDVLLGPPHLRTHAQRRLVHADTTALNVTFPNNKFTSRFVHTRRGVEVHVESWVPVDSEGNVKVPKGVVCLLHGYGDCSRWFQRYFQAFYVRLGYAVVAVEYEGHGWSSGWHIYIHDFHGMVQDCVESFQDEVERITEMVGDANPVEAKEDLQLKQFLAGESMGGGIALCLSLVQPDTWDGVILCAPMCKIAEHIRPPAALMNILRVLAKLFPKLSIVPSKIGAHLTCKDEVKRKLSTENPYRWGRKPRLCSALALLGATEYIEENMHKVTVPLLILHGQADLVTDPTSSQVLHDRVGSVDKHINLYPDVWHCFTGEDDQVFLGIQKDIASWLLARS